LVVFWHF